jgi:glucokinase
VDVVGVDVGGTKILAATVGPRGELESSREWATPTGSAAHAVEAIIDAVRAIAPQAEAAGVGVPGLVDADGLVAGAVNLPLREVRLRDELEAALGIPVVVENDAGAAAYAEWALGPRRDLAMITLGTGMGGGAVTGGQLLRAPLEIGHLVLERAGGRVYLESICSGRAADARARAAFGPDADARELVRRGRQGDAQALAILEQLGQALGLGAGSLANALGVELIVVGGGFAAAGELLFEAARPVLRREALAPLGERAELARARLGREAGVIGAGLLARAQLDLRRCTQED